MTRSFKEIGDTINTEMLKVKNTDSRVGNVYNYDVKIEGGINMPAIIITPTNGTEEILDSCCNGISFNYSVRVIDSIQDGISTAENNIRELADLVLERLKDISTITRTVGNGSTLDLTFDYIFGWADTQEPIRVFEITCKFNGIENK